MALIELTPAFGMRRISEPEDITSEVWVNETAPSIAAFVTAATSDWLQSPKYQWMVTGQRYYENKNDIQMRERKVIGRDGQMTKAPYLANNRLSHSFLKKLVNQKVSYLLSKPFTWKSDDKAFQDVLGEYFNNDFFRMFKNGCKEAVVKGLGWLQVYYDESGKLAFKRIPATEIIPFWADIDHTQLNAAVRVFETVEFIGTSKSIVKHYQYFTPTAVYNFVATAAGLVPDAHKPIEYNFQLNPLAESDGSATEYFMWDRIPLIPLKYNSEEDCLLKYIKSLIDDYDRNTSNLSNAIEDEPDRIKVVKDYDGTDKGEFVYNLARYRTLFIRSTGDVQTLDNSISHEAVEAHLKRLHNDIYEFGGGVDMTTRDLGDSSGTALKFVFSDLDMDCQYFGNELAWALEQLCWFIKQDQLLRGNDYTAAKIEIAFNTDITINETETIQNIMNSVGLVSKETLLEQHPYVTDLTEEMQRIAEEEEEARAQEEELLRTEASLRNSGSTSGVSS